MSKFTWNETVKVVHGAPQEWRPGETASVVGMIQEEERLGSFRERFPRGIVYTIEFEDGSSIEVDEASLELVESENAPRQ